MFMDEKSTKASDTSKSVDCVIQAVSCSEEKRDGEDPLKGHKKNDHAQVLLLGYWTKARYIEKSNEKFKFRLKIPTGTGSEYKIKLFSREFMVSENFKWTRTNSKGGDKSSSFVCRHRSDASKDLGMKGKVDSFRVREKKEIKKSVQLKTRGDGNEKNPIQLLDVDEQETVKADATGIDLGEHKEYTKSSIVTTDVEDNDHNGEDDEDNVEVVCWECGAVEEEGWHNMIACNGYTDITGALRICDGLYHRQCIIDARKRNQEGDLQTTESTLNKKRKRSESKDLDTIDIDERLGDVIGVKRKNLPCELGRKN